MVRSVLVVIGILLSLFQIAIAEDDAVENGRRCDRTLVVDTTENGMAFTDLNMLQRTLLGIPRTPIVNVLTFPNATMFCKNIGARLPELAEVDGIASYISENFLLDRRSENAKVLKAKFMTDKRYFWTNSTREISPMVYERALASLLDLEDSVDMSKARVQYVGTHLDLTEYRPFICVFDPIVE